MGKKKRSYPDVDELLNRAWCYYCERDFEDLKLLVSHQKAKHFKCDRCGKRLGTAGGLGVHMNQVHKEQLKTIENALPNRQGPEIEIFGMVGIPDEIMAQHNQRIIQQFYQSQAERQAETGNPMPGDGSGGGGGANGARKKIKTESPEELKRRFAEHRAQVLAQKAGGGDAMQGVQRNGATPTFDLPPSSSGAYAQGHYGQAPQAPVLPPGSSSLPARPQPAGPPPPGGAWPAGLPPPQYALPHMQQQQQAGGASTLDELIAGAASGAAGDDIDRVIRMAEAGIRTAQPVVAASAAQADDDDDDGAAAGGKKKKDKASRMVYADSEVSPEERMAEMERYRWVEVS